jgi:hypothetical protein
VLAKNFIFEELVPILDKCKYMTSPSIKNILTTFRYLWRFGVMDSITMLRGSNTGLMSKFSGQVFDSDKVFLLKMSKVGPSSGVDLVKWMQPGDDL